MRVLTLFLGILLFTSCDNLPFTKKATVQAVDTIVDFTAVDTYPSFKACDSIINKVEKQDCFRTTIHQKIGEELQKYQLTSKDSIDETIFVDLIISNKGQIVFKEIHSSDVIKNQLPILDSLLQQSVTNLPTIYPAIKRGIPVTTAYKLPIRILLKE